MTIQQINRVTSCDFYFQLQFEPGRRLEVVSKINHIKYSFAIDTGSTAFIINADNLLIRTAPKMTDCENYGKYSSN